MRSKIFYFIVAISVFILITNCKDYKSSNNSIFQADSAHLLVNSQKVSENTEKQEELLINFLKSLNGKYPHEVNLFEKDFFKQRLKQLLGDNRYDFLIERWDVETPITIEDNFFIVEACEVHNCGYTDFIIVIDFSKNIMQVGIREEGNEEFFLEKGSKFKHIKNWANV